MHAMTVGQRGRYEGMQHNLFTRCAGATHAKCHTACGDDACNMLTVTHTACGDHACNMLTATPVSYTHLTLPTKVNV